MEYEKEIRVKPLLTAVSCRLHKLLLLLLFVACYSMLPAQYIWQERTGCAIAQGDLAPGYLLAEKRLTAYVDGDAAIFFDNRFAAEGALWASFATASQGQLGIRRNEALFWGAEYHFLKPSRWDPFIAFTPGVGLVQVVYNDGEIKSTPYTAVPLASAAIGCNYYVGSVFHFFIKVQGVVGQITSTLPTTQCLDELKFTGGLAFNLRLWKPRNYMSKG